VNSKKQKMKMPNRPRHIPTPPRQPRAIPRSLPRSLPHLKPRSLPHLKPRPRMPNPIQKSQRL
jgi:hypothetical protein